MQVALASSLAQLPLAGLRREHPHKLDHVVASDADVRTPRELHPAFYGCFDWHSAVHGHWTLARLLHRCPDLPERAAIEAMFDELLTPANLAVEVAYFRSDRQSFERPYGWGWLLALAAELANTRWADAVTPLAELIARRFEAYLPTLHYPVRTGVHANTAFAMSLAHDYARVHDAALAKLIAERAHAYFGTDTDYRAAWEPSGEDFLSPALAEADLMRRVAADFPAWLRAFFPHGLPQSLRAPARVSDRSDPKHAHLDGLNLSRARCLHAIAAALPAAERGPYTTAAELHRTEGLAHVATGDYAGEHWLATFAVALLT